MKLSIHFRVMDRNRAVAHWFEWRRGTRLAHVRLTSFCRAPGVVPIGELDGGASSALRPVGGARLSLPVVRIQPTSRTPNEPDGQRPHGVGPGFAARGYASRFAHQASGLKAEHDCGGAGNRTQVRRLLSEHSPSAADGHCRGEHRHQHRCNPVVN